MIRRGLRWGKRWLRRFGRKIFHRPAVFEPAYTLEDNVQVVVYADNPALFPDYSPRMDPTGCARLAPVRVSLVATARNEVQSARQWFEAVWRQIRLPDEIIVVDTGSSDGTREILKALAGCSPVPVRVIETENCNIAAGRNCAIEAARYEVIAVTDFGTTAHPDWLERLIAPFEIDPRTEVSGGWYRAVDEQGVPRLRRFWLDLKGRNPQDILSPSATIAFTRQAWKSVHGYPEWLTLTGEDTYFDLELRRCCSHWALVPQALVDWQSPLSMGSHWKRLFRWSTGDGESGFNADFYWRTARFSLLHILAVLSGLAALLLACLTGQTLWGVLTVLIALGYGLFLLRRAWRLRYYPLDLLWLCGAEIAQTAGFLRGAARREDVTRRRLAGVKGLYFLFVGVPLDDTGGGSRFTQMALELIRQGYAVAYVYKFSRDEAADLRLMIRHPNLFHFQIKRFNLRQFLAQIGVQTPLQKTAALVEVPLQDWVPVLDELRGAGARIVYDLVDDWQSFLGSDWYSPQVEDQIIARADHLTATLPLLQDRLQNRSEKTVSLLPNAVNRRLFNPERAYLRPSDFPVADWSVIYTGALYGPWFDWQLLLQVARAFPEAALVLIGDYRGQCPEKLPNLHFLGLKPQTSLPAYLAHANVAVIPWKVEAITLATSPLKLFEYLAMRKPVVVPDLPALRGFPYVYPASSASNFIANIAAARRVEVGGKALEEFLAANSWQTRISDLCNIVEMPA